ncbi:glycogen debranching protein GlgX [Pasteurella multocida]|uniref:glycogen debranching protein GlgX n=1 Tax=Pasteurella multocida TaxID=747 RepID=UPI002021AD6C|nr:glycogen debranching protein GlgX [Pasteurella multocida]MCL7826486.1 glycogen debranching protein GlgX [Pasteurella multocida]URI05209.1 glycogen debranching protein GlgX [Pasteurella multocida]HDR1315172.1 glycogen debranching protein GlgX [Pasteurella multocida]
MCSQSDNVVQMNTIKSGKPSPLGCSKQTEEGQDGYNFALFSQAARRVELCLFSEGQERRVDLQPSDDGIWHIWLSDVSVGTEYAYRISGKTDRTLANPNKLMLDPYAKAVVGKPDLSTAEKRAWFDLNDPRDNAHLAPKAVIIDEAFDWQGDKPLRTPWAQTVIYEMHVKGFSQLREDLPEALRGTYAGLAHPNMIAYLQDLGVTAVELLPVQYQADEVHLQEKGLANYWGYNPLAMFALEPRYSAQYSSMGALHEFKTMVKALHQAGIEVILDVVFNHTAESEKYFPTFSQRGIDDETYYWQDAQGHYHNWTGCGNTLNLSQPITRRWVLDCLCYWVEACHVDGFRFDLGSVLGREGEGGFNPQAQLFADIQAEPRLQGCKLIAEPWDIGDFGYQMGNFPAYFAEWNDRFRDDVTRFWLWKSGESGAFAQRLAGSSDLFQQTRQVHNSINFITAHDGFTLRDLVSYNEKHNWANGENNRDGRNHNYSYNHGVEGIDNVPSAVENGRLLSSIALLMNLLLANGTPMLLAGDEFGNSQFGNNNAYCQDNEIAWLKWQDFNPVLFNATKQTIALRKQIASLQQDCWWSEVNVQWLNTKGEPMTIADWHNQESKALQVLLDNKWLFLINAKQKLQTFSLPEGDWEVMYCATNLTTQGGFIELDDVTFGVLQQLNK